MQKEVEARVNATMEKGQELFIIAPDKMQRMNEFANRDPEAGLRGGDSVIVRANSAIVKGVRRNNNGVTEYPAINALVVRNGKTLPMQISVNTVLSGTVYPLSAKLIERDGKKFIALSQGVRRFGKHLQGVTIIDDTNEKGEHIQHLSNDTDITFTVKDEQCHSTVFGTYSEKYRDNEVNGETTVACAL